MLKTPLFFTIILFILFLHPIHSAKKLKIHWVNNGGNILSTFHDWIVMRIMSTPLSRQIVCPKESNKFFDYTPGQAYRFNDLWFAADGVVNIQIQQKNIIGKSNSININHFIDTNKVGFYETKMRIQDIKVNASFTLAYQGYGVTIDIDNYQRSADYYILFQLLDEQVSKDTYNLENGVCELCWRKLQVCLIVILSIVLALF